MTCPHCETVIKYEDVRDAFTNHTYATYFDWPCPYCDFMIRVTVHAAPDFELTDPARTC